MEGSTPVLKNPIISISDFGVGNYKKIIRLALKDGASLFTLREYNKKIVDFCSLNNRVVEDEYDYLPTFFERKMERIFREKGPINLGIIFNSYDFRLGEKIITNTCKYSRFLTILNYRNSKRIQEKIFNLNGLVINVENSLDKIRKKCDIVIDVNKKIEEEEYK